MRSQSALKNIEKYQKWLETEIISCTPEPAPSIPREIILTQKGKQYEQRKQNLKKELESISVVTIQVPSFQPLLISRSPRSTQNSSYASVEDRLITAGRKYQLARDERMKQQFAEETPLRRRRSAVQTNVHERLMNMKKIYNDRNDMLALANAQKQQNVLKNPVICKNSREMVGKRSGKVEDRLIQERVKIETIRKAKEAVAEFESGLISRPMITKLASSLVRTESIEDRLLNYTHRYNENLKTLSIKYDSNHSFKPEITKLGRSRSPSPVISTIRSRTPTPPRYSPSMDSYSSRRDTSPSNSTYKLTSRSSNSLQAFNFTPEINSHSKQLASQMGSSTERLMRPLRKENIPPDDDFTFKPLINSKSKQLDNRKKYDEDGNKKTRWDALYELSEFLKHRRRELKEEYEFKREDRNCTFRPYLGKTPPRDRSESYLNI